MTQLVNRIRHIERLKVEKARTHKYKREKVAYIEIFLYTPSYKKNWGLYICLVPANRGHLNFGP